MCWDGDLSPDDHDSIKEHMIKACIPFKYVSAVRTAAN